MTTETSPRRRGPERKTVCVNGHDLSVPGAVRVTTRKRGDKEYPERQCVECTRARSREAARSKPRTSRKSYTQAERRARGWISAYDKTRMGEA